MSVLSVECELREDAMSRWNILSNNTPSRPRGLMRINTTMKGRSSVLEIGLFLNRWNILSNNTPSRPQDLIRTNTTMKGRGSILEIGFFLNR